MTLKLNKLAEVVEVRVHQATCSGFMSYRAVDKLFAL